MADPVEAAVRARYRAFREISRRVYSEMRVRISASAIREQGRRLGLLDQGTLVAENLDEFSLIFDLLFHTAPPGRSRGIDRYARAVSPPAGSDEERMVAALRNARFSIWRVDGPYETAGVTVTDMIRGEIAWLMDESFETQAQPGTLLAMRVSQPDAFIMHCGVLVPLGPLQLADLYTGIAQRLTGAPHENAADRRFAEAVYRIAVADRLMDRVSFRSTGPEGPEE